jgi:integrase
MPQAKLTQTYVQSLQSTPKRQIFRDLTIPGLVLFVEPSGKKTWYVDYKRPNGKRTYHKIGPAEILTVMQARDVAQKFLASVKLGNDPIEVKEVKKERLTLRQLIFDHYSLWVIDNRRSGKETVDILNRAFGDFMDWPTEEISMLAIEQWRSRARKEKGLKASSLNRRTTALKALLNWAVKRGIIEVNPMARLERLREEDSNMKVRYLSPEERERLFAALDEREMLMRNARDSHNEWLESREEEVFPDLSECAFTDHLKPMVIVSLNTGIRKGSLFQLLWSDIDFKEGILTIRPPAEKNSKLLHIPMNGELEKTLKAWQKQTRGKDDELVFPSPRTGKVLNNCQSAWENLLKSAEIRNFRWHDMRHDFASQLVMAGIDLNTVRDLLGHADLKMTLRYAHLAPENKRQAVRVLEKRNNSSFPQSQIPEVSSDDVE